jgi:16S rRNA (cytidine1402-2'-O)-methyltransferase
MGEAILSRILAGENCALVSDAGTPLVSDPGAGLTRLCLQKGVKVVPIPGACAAVTALSASAIPAGRFSFEGFLSVKTKARKAHLAEIKAEPRTMVFYEAPHKLISTLSDLLEAPGDRDLMIGRELTKLHEEIWHTTITAALAFYQQNKPKGEFVLVVAGALEKQNEPKEESEAVDEILSSEGSFKERVKELQNLGLSRNEAYQLALEKKKQGEE